MKIDIEIVEELASKNCYNVEAISEEVKFFCNKVEKSMEEILEKLPPLPEESSIYRVPKQLCSMNPKAYLPQLISIGPFHYNTQKDLIANEQYKLRAFIKFLYHMNESDQNMVPLKDILKAGTLKVVVEKSHCWMKQVWNSYASSINMKEDEFIIMMLVDACFIIEFLTDTFFYKGIMFEIYHDLVKLENQVPFFLLQRLLGLLPKHRRFQGPHFMGLAQDIADMSGSLNQYANSNSMYGSSNYKEPKHFVDYLNSYFPSPLDDMTYNKQQEENGEKKKIKSFLSFIHTHVRDFWNKMIHCVKNKEKKPRKFKQIPPSITELWEAGVTVRKAENPKFITNITFKSGVLQIPHLAIYDNFEFIMRNLIAFEQFSDPDKNTYVIEYFTFMDRLISTEKDVRLLVDVGVINNSIGGSDKEVTDLFNNLGKFVTFSSDSSPYKKISNDLREHCDEWWNRAKASLKHNYFNTPWAIISFFAATLLIILTILQTIFSAISTFPTKLKPISHVFKYVI